MSALVASDADEMSARSVRAVTAPKSTVGPARPVPGREIAPQWWIAAIMLGATIWALILTA